MNQLINNRDFKFHLYQVQEIEKLTNRDRYNEHNKETFDAVLDTAEKIAVKYFLPHNHLSDQNEPKFVDGKVEMLDDVKQAFDAFREAGFIAASTDFEQGGMQLPFTVAMAASGYFTSANPSTTGYGFLTTGAANLIDTFGNEQQKRQFLPAMLTGDFSGTMALTEVDTSSGASRQGIGFFTHRADFQTNDGANGSSNDGSSNTTLNLHNRSNVNYLFADGHVESLYPLSTRVVGASGPSSAWDGIWSVTAGD